MQLKKATRQQVKLRLNLSAPSGAGKTYSALLLAKGLVGDWDKIAVIDTENRSASLYEHLGSFNVIDLAPPFSPERYSEAITTCVNAGMECIIIDSSTHEWNGAGGCIEINERLAQSKYKGNTWSAWNETTPRHDKFINTVLQCPIHVITCTRSKMETVMGDDRKVKKVGMKDIQREGWEYELTVSLSIDRDTHMAIPSKDRTELFEGKEPFIITEATGKLIADWCNKGIAVEPIVKPSYDATIQVINAATSTEMLTQIWQQLNVDAKSEATVIEAVKVKGELLKFESFLITAYDNQVLAYRQALQNEVDHSINVGATPEQILLEEVAIPKIEKFEAKAITKEQMQQVVSKIEKPNFKAICAEFRKQLK